MDKRNNIDVMSCYYYNKNLNDNSLSLQIRY
jgi:hypothetical protein